MLATLATISTYPLRLYNVLFTHYSCTFVGEAYNASDNDSPADAVRRPTNHRK